MGWSRVSGAFCLAGQLERAVEVADAARSAAQELTMPLAFATASYFRSIPLLWLGNVLEAFADLEQARDAQRFGWRHFTRGAAAQYALCLLERDDVHSAERVLEEEPLGHVRDVEDCMRVFALAEVRLAQGRAADALQVALRAGEEMGGHVLVLGYTPWRITAAKAALAAGLTAIAGSAIAAGNNPAPRSMPESGRLRERRLCVPRSHP